MKQIIEKIKDEISYEKECMNTAAPGWSAEKQTAFIGGLERALEIAIEEHDLADPKPEEIEYMSCEAEELIKALMDVIEDGMYEYYSSSDLILKCDKWLKWANEESDAAELKEFFNYPN